MDVKVDRGRAHRAIFATAADATSRLSRNLRDNRRQKGPYSFGVIWFLRHGDATDEAPSDAERRLTEKGERQAAAAAGALAVLGVSLDACLSSAKRRARDTARTVAEELGLEVEVVEALGGGDFDPLELVAGRGEVLLVGHEPDFSRAIQALTGARVELKKGGMAAVDAGALKSLLRAPQLRAIAGRAER